MNNKEGLTANEINDLLQESKFKSNPSVQIFGKSVSIDALTITSISIFVWILIWKVFGLFNLGNYSIAFFILNIFLEILNIFNSSTDTEINVETEVGYLQNVITRIIGVFGIIILVFVFLFNIQMNNDIKNTCYKILSIVLIYFAISLFIIEPKNDTRNIRNIRLIIEKFYNQGIILFMLTIYFIYLGIMQK
jgi:hypothetical protein